MNSQPENSNVATSRPIAPQARSDCRGGPRPCPFVSCKYHLFLVIDPRKATVSHRVDASDIWEIPFTCALDIAEMGGAEFLRVSKVLNLSVEYTLTLHNAAVSKILGRTPPEPVLA